MHIFHFPNFPLFACIRREKGGKFSGFGAQKTFWRLDLGHGHSGPWIHQCTIMATDLLGLKITTIQLKKKYHTSTIHVHS